MIRPASLFEARDRQTWLLIFFCALYFIFCWFIYSLSIEPLYELSQPVYISADSGAYYIVAGLATEHNGVAPGDLVGYGGSPLGPVIIALIGRTVFGVAIINCVLFSFSVWWSGKIRGVRRELFILLLALCPQTVPTLMTLNKEILAISGLVAFAAYIYPNQETGAPRHSVLLLIAGMVLSVMARWEQALILCWYLAAESRYSPAKGRPRRAVVFLLLATSAAYAIAVNILKIDLSGFLSQIEGGGTIVRLYSIQAKGGYFLVALPKILMNLSGRWITPIYFLTDYWQDSFGSSDWQNAYIGPLSSLFMLILTGYAVMSNRFRLSRPLIHLATIYFICTAINPFVQPRYMYPGFALVALELSRRRSMLEPVQTLPTIMPPLPASYRPRAVPKPGDTLSA